MPKKHSPLPPPEKKFRFSSSRWKIIFVSEQKFILSRQSKMIDPRVGSFFSERPRKKTKIILPPPPPGKKFFITNDFSLGGENFTFAGKMKGRLCLRRFGKNIYVFDRGSQKNFFAQKNSVFLSPGGGAKFLFTPVRE